MGLREKITETFEGKVVRKDLTKEIKGNAVVPSYVLEYLLGQHCATFDEDVIKQGVENVKAIIRDHFVRRDEAEIIKSTVRDKGQHKIIDKVAAKLNEKKDIYEANFANLGIKNVPISNSIIKKHKKLLTSGVWCIITLGYEASDEKETPWIIHSLKPIQVSHVDIDEYREARKKFSKEEWIDLLMQSIGLNPKQFTFRSKLIQLARLVPFCENNYNLIELGPKGTGKSHIYSELSPHGIVISGSEVTQAKLFVNNSTGQIGLVGFWDTVAFDEFGGSSKKGEKGLVDIMKNYMANKSFSRGTHVYTASASMVFVGNTEHSVPYMLKKSNLFDALPKQYYDSAFLDRVHSYLPGWEVSKLRTEMFTNEYGFIVDYLAEILRELRKEDYTNTYKDYFELSDSLTTRDRDSIAKTYSGLVKIIYPNQDQTQEQAKELFDFAVEVRKRVKQQLIKMDDTFEEVDFSYTLKPENKTQSIQTLEYLTYQSDESDKSEKTSTESGGQEQREDQPETEKEPPKETHQKSIYENQTGISYKKLFGRYLKGASDIQVIDPYIRQPYQIRNFMEFCSMVADMKQEGEEVKIHLITNNEKEYIEETSQALEEIKDSLEPLGIFLVYQFQENSHDRYIITDTGWKIILGRGLDIFQKSSGNYDLAGVYQEKRKCKQTEITYLPE